MQPKVSRVRCSLCPVVSGASLLFAGGTLSAGTCPKLTKRASCCLTWFEGRLVLPCLGQA
eukprot:15304042-Alexandrium_andersonii.AAC.1